MPESARRQASRIEGGVDAIVIGASADAFAAAALLAKEGLHVVLIEMGPSPPRDRREFAPGYFAESGDPLAAALDQETVDSLDLYRHGLTFARRRLETFVRFSDSAALVLPGDPEAIGASVAEMSEADAEPFLSFLDRERKTARALFPWFSGAEPPPRFDEVYADAVASSVDGAVVGRFSDQRLEDYLRAEAALGATSRPSEPYTFLALLRRWAGDAAGLQGAVAAIEGGGRGLVTAIRRAGQAAGVATRQTDRVNEVIVEWDRVAGVEFDDGAQIRAPIVVSALPARQSFFDLIGRTRLDIEFARALDLPPPGVVSVRVHLAVAGRIADSHAAARLDRRFLFAPSAHELDAAFRAAGEGGIAAAPIAELVFASAFDRSLAPEGCSSATMLLHPSADRPPSDESWRAEIARVATAVFARIAPGSASLIKAIEVDGFEPAAPPTGAAVERRRLLSEGSGLEGYFFCGEEALIGGGVSLIAGRRAAERALAYYRKAGER